MKSSPHYHREHGSQMPAAVEAEKGVLAACIHKGAPVVEYLESYGFKQEYFYNVNHQTVWNAIQRLHTDRREIDAISICELLIIEDERKDIGFQFINELADKIETVNHYQTHAGIVAERYHERSLIKQFQTGLAIIQEATDFGATQEGVRKLVDEIKHIESSSDLAFSELLRERLFNARQEPPEMRVIYSVNGIPICTPGNLTAITAQAKAGKSAFCDSLTAAAMVTHDLEVDTLGIEGPNTERLAMVYLDTEQSPDDFWHLMNRAMRRARVSECPDWLYPYCLTGLTTRECRKALQTILKQVSVKHGGVFAFIVDGVADLVGDVNDPEESNTFVTELHGLAIKYDCSGIGVIHMNPKSGKGQADKVRGHLGSQLERKAETNLKLVKTDDKTEVYSEKQRRAPILQGHGPTFKWSDEASMHVSVKPSAPEPSQNEKELWFLAEEIFEEKHSYTYTELWQLLMVRGKCSESTAKRKVARMDKLHIIKRVAGRITANFHGKVTNE